MDKSKNNQLTSKKILFWIYFFSFAIGITTFYFVCFFLYQNFYKTIKQSEKIIYYKKQTANESVNMEKFQAIVKMIEKKTELRKEIETNNPFE
jgi:hypothetical protein